MCEKLNLKLLFKKAAMPFSTFSLKAKDVKSKWYLVDAKDLVVGRLSVAIARLMRAKNDPKMTLHMNHGVHVVVVNAEKVYFTAGKDKIHYRHTGYPGGIKTSVPSEILKGNYPERVLKRSIERMMGKAGPLRRDRMKNLYVYAGESHPHQGQSPVPLDVGSWNSKNKRRDHHA